MGAVLRELADALDCLLAALTHDVGGAELLPQRGALGIAAEQEDPLAAESLRRDHRAQPDGPVAHDRDRLARTDGRRDSRVVAGSHHVGEREPTTASARRP